MPSRSSVPVADFDASVPSGRSLLCPELGLFPVICTSTFAKLIYENPPSFFLSLKTLYLIVFGKLSRVVVLESEMFQK